MTTQQKLATIQKILNETQTQLASRFGVSFVAFNGWWTGKSTPRATSLSAIDALFLAVTGQSVVPSENLTLLKHALAKRAAAFPNAVHFILEHPDVRDQLILKLTYNSNSIEGSTLTEADTFAVIFDDTVLPSKSLAEHLEAKNHQSALIYMLRHVLAERPLDEDFVLRVHGILMSGIMNDAGSYRSHAVRIVGISLPTANYLKIPELMNEVMRQASANANDPVALSASVHAQFEKIHPFSDGNGRVGRILMAAMLLQANFAPAIIRQDRKRLYYTYLYKAQTNGDHSQLESFLCDAVADGFKVLERQ